MTEKLKYLVLDTGAFIKGNVIELYNKAENIVTISEVIGEIRDSKARDVLERLPFEVELRNPSVESIKAGEFFMSNKEILNNLYQIVLRL